MIIRYLIYLAIAAAAVVSTWAFLEKRCNTACKDVKLAWDADKAERVKRTSEITLELSNRWVASTDAAAKLKGESDARIAALSARVSSVPAGARVTLPAATARLLDDAARAGNAPRAGADAGAEARADPVPDAASSAVYDARALTQYFVDGPAAYADAYQLWKAARAREDACIDALNKGVATQ